MLLIVEIEDNIGTSHELKIDIHRENNAIPNLKKKKKQKTNKNKLKFQFVSCHQTKYTMNESL